MIGNIIKKIQNIQKIQEMIKKTKKIKEIKKMVDINYICLYIFICYITKLVYKMLCNSFFYVAFIIQ